MSETRCIKCGGPLPSAFMYCPAGCAGSPCTDGTNESAVAPFVIDPIMQFFRYEHLPANLRAISKPFAEIANWMLDLPKNAERSVALRKLLEAKDAAVRAVIAK